MIKYVIYASSIYEDCSIHFQVLNAEAKINHNTLFRIVKVLFILVSFKIYINALRCIITSFLRNIVDISKDKLIFQHLLA